MSSVLRTILSVFLAALLATAANAHNRSESYSHWYLSDDGVTATVTIPLREVTRLPGFSLGFEVPAEVFATHLRDSVSVASASGTCALLATTPLQTVSGFVRVEMSFGCADTVRQVHYRAMFDVAPAHVHYTKLHRDGAPVSEILVTDAADTWRVDHVASPARSHSFVSFLRLGIEHIAGGYDHIAFLCGMLLIAGSLGRSIVAVTGFTLGHSVSLAAAVLGYVYADGQLVEAFIGFTVALVAAEFFLLRTGNVAMLALTSTAVAWLVGTLALLSGLIGERAVAAYLGFGVFAFCYLVAASRLEGIGDRRATALLFVATAAFGLVHGFGFAGFLMDTGTLGGALFVPLLGFNLGVEIGQLVIVAVVLSLVWLLRDRIPRAMPSVVAATLCGVGMFWFVGRTLA